ncbi:hypothetical protein PAMA_014285 [Pampus argenteus]
MANDSPAKSLVDIDLASLRRQPRPCPQDKKLSPQRGGLATPDGHTSTSVGGLVPSWREAKQAHLAVVKRSCDGGQGGLSDSSVPQITPFHGHA